MDIKNKVKDIFCLHKYLFIVLIYFAFFYLTYVYWKSSNYLQPWLDYAYFDQFIWKYSQFKKPVATLWIPINLLWQHLHLILLWLAPFYWLTDSPNLLWTLDAIVIIASIIPVYLIANKLIDNKLQSAIVAFLYWNSLWIQFAIDFQFHEITIFMWFFMWAYYFLLNKDWKIFYILMFLCLLCKENIWLYFTFFWIYVAVAHKEKKHWFIISILGTIWLFAALKIFIPYFRWSSYIYFTFNAIWKNPSEFIVNSLTNPLIIFTTLANPLRKLITLGVMFSSWLFLILVSPTLLLLTVPMIMERFLNDQPHMWQLSQHYNVSIWLIITLWIIYWLNKTKIIFKDNTKLITNTRYLILALLIFINIFFSFYLVTPYKKIFIQRSNLRTDAINRISIENAIQKIPKNASLGWVSWLISHFSKRDIIQYLPKWIWEMDYLIINKNIKEIWPYKDLKEIEADILKIENNYNKISDDWMTIIYKKR